MQISSENHHPHQKKPEGKLGPQGRGCIAYACVWEHACPCVGEKGRRGQGRKSSIFVIIPSGIYQLRFPP